MGCGVGRWSSDPQHLGKIITALGIPTTRAGGVEVGGTQELAGQWKLNPGPSGSVEGLISNVQWRETKHT